jgi:hypothetical protein
MEGEPIFQSLAAINLAKIQEVPLLAVLPDPGKMIDMEPM